MCGWTQDAGYPGYWGCCGIIQPGDQLGKCAWHQMVEIGVQIILEQYNYNYGKDNDQDHDHDDDEKHNQIPINT